MAISQGVRARLRSNDMVLDYRTRFEKKLQFCIAGSICAQPDTPQHPLSTPLTRSDIVSVLPSGCTASIVAAIAYAWGRARERFLPRARRRHIH